VCVSAAAPAREAAPRAAPILPAAPPDPAAAAAGSHADRWLWRGRRRAARPAVRRCPIAPGAGAPGRRVPAAVPRSGKASGVPGSPPGVAIVRRSMARQYDLMVLLDA